jgi:hypothetical protein
MPGTGFDMFSKDSACFFALTFSFPLLTLLFSVKCYPFYSLSYVHDLVVSTRFDSGTHLAFSGQNWDEINKFHYPSIDCGWIQVNPRAYRQRPQTIANERRRKQPANVG